MRRVCQTLPHRVDLKLAAREPFASSPFDSSKLLTVSACERNFFNRWFTTLRYFNPDSLYPQRLRLQVGRIGISLNIQLNDDSIEPATTIV